jgi:hypothetical protein
MTEKELETAENIGHHLSALLTGFPCKDAVNAIGFLVALTHDSYSQNNLFTIPLTLDEFSTLVAEIAHDVRETKTR